MILTIAACKYIFLSSSTALLVCSTSYTRHTDPVTLVHYDGQYVMDLSVLRTQCCTCGVSRCIDVVILNLVLLLVKLIFNENVDSASISSWKHERECNIRKHISHKTLEEHLYGSSPNFYHKAGSSKLY